METTSDLITKRIVTVTFNSDQSAKEYSYFTDIMGVSKGDYVVVDTQYGPKVAKVERDKALAKAQRQSAGKWVICRVDLDAFKAKMEQYDLLAEIEAEIEERMQSVNRIKFYQQAAKDDPIIYELVKKLQSITGAAPAIEDKTE